MKTSNKWFLTFLIILGLVLFAPHPSYSYSSKNQRVVIVHNGVYMEYCVHELKAAKMVMAINKKPVGYQFKLVTGELEDTFDTTFIHQINVDASCNYTALTTYGGGE